MIEFTLVALGILGVLVWFYRLGAREKADPKARAKAKLKRKSSPPKKPATERNLDCAACGGKGWILKKEYHQLAQYAGTAGKRPCPSCSP